jgi:predicted nucleotidyltransferase
MTAATQLEKKLVLQLFKDFTTNYNPSSVAKVLGKTRVGAFKALNSLEKDSIVRGRNLGRARFYRINLEDEYARINVETLLMEEAKKYLRWKDELKGLFECTNIVILFGSTIRNEEKAHDIDLLLVYDKNNNNKVNQFIKEKNQLLIKKLHPIKQTRDDLRRNIIKRDKVVIDAIRSGIVLHGYEKIIGMIKNATSRE